MTTRPYYLSNHSSPAAVHEASFAQKWKKTTNKWILGRSQAHAGKSPHNLFLCDLITVIVGWVSGGHSRGELLSIRIHRRNPKNEHLVLDTGSETKLRKKKTNTSTGDLSQCSRWQNGFHLIQRYHKNLGFWTPALFCWCAWNMTFYTFIY